MSSGERPIGAAKGKQTNTIPSSPPVSPCLIRLTSVQGQSTPRVRVPALQLSTPRSIEAPSKAVVWGLRLREEGARLGEPHLEESTPGHGAHGEAPSSQQAINQRGHKGGLERVSTCCQLPPNRRQITTKRISQPPSVNRQAPSSTAAGWSQQVSAIHWALSAPSQSKRSLTGGL